jgi:hypothetical protein
MMMKDRGSCPGLEKLNEARSVSERYFAVRRSRAFPVPPSAHWLRQEKVIAGLERLHAAAIGSLA